MLVLAEELQMLAGEEEGGGGARSEPSFAYISNKKAHVWARRESVTPMGSELVLQ